jgi:Ran GTPase-activating protein (RanGAP) involved in mRNA processing and transport
VDNVLNNRVMTSLDLSDNKLGTLVSPGGWSSTPWGVWKYRHTGTGGKADTKPKGEEFKPEGILALANVIPDMRALLKLDISNNSLYVAGAKALAKALSDNQVLTDLNVACNSLGEERDCMPDTSGIVALANTIKDMGGISVLSLKGNNLRANGGKALAEGLSGNQVIKELNIADNNLANGGTDMSGVVALADAIPNMGALVSANLFWNDIGANQAHAFASILKEHPALKSLCGNKGDETELDMTGSEIGVEGAIMLAQEFTNNEARKKIAISGNAMNAAGCMVIVEALQGNNTLTELNIAKNGMTWGRNTYGDMSAVIALSKILPSMGALSKIIFGGDPDDYGMCYEPAILEVGMTEADLSKKNLGVGGAIIISAWLIHKDNGTLSYLNIANNKLGEFTGWNYVPENEGNKKKWTYVHTDGREQDEKPTEHTGRRPWGAIALANAIKDNRALSALSLKDNRLGTKEAGKVLGEMLKENSMLKALDLSKNYVSKCEALGFAQGLAVGIKDNVALSVFLLKSNNIRAEGGGALAKGLRGNNMVTELNIADNNLAEDSNYEPDISGVTALVDVAGDMEALTKLDISGNNIPSEQKGDLQRICAAHIAAGGIELAIRDPSRD